MERIKGDIEKVYLTSDGGLDDSILVGSSSALTKLAIEILTVVAESPDHAEEVDIEGHKILGGFFGKNVARHPTHPVRVRYIYKPKNNDELDALLNYYT